MSLAKFRSGRMVATANAAKHLTSRDIIVAVGRHLQGDWGDLGAEDRRSNDRALVEGSRLLSAYRGENGTKFWIITEWDRSVTTILLPEDY